MLKDFRKVTKEHRLKWLATCSMRYHEVDICEADRLEVKVKALEEKKPYILVDVEVMEIWWSYLQFSLKCVIAAMAPPMQVFQ